jgi:hypothetical protein
MWWIYLLPLLAVFLFAFGSFGCNRPDLPRSPGDYPIQNNEIRFDGQDYVFRWVAPDSSIHLVKTSDVKLAQDDHTFLRVGSSTPELHLAEQQPIQVAARDDRGNFVTPWFPFLWGPFGGGTVINVPRDTGGDVRNPTYRYPPTDSFGRGDQLGGSVPSSKPRPPDYTNLPNASNTVGGQSGGTGGGAAATGKSSAPVGGQSGGAGSGSAASGKGGFQSGPNAYSDSRNAPSAPLGGKPSSADGSQPKGGGNGASGSGALKGPSGGAGGAKAPSAPSGGSKGIGGARR